ncbi:MAG: hypothetical protein ACPGJU_01675 [Coraliomargarita sp.]
MNTENTQSSSVLATAALCSVALLIVACSPADEATTAPTTSHNTTTALLLKDAPIDTLSVYEARQQAKPGEAIQVSGQIGGTAKPFITGYAGFVLADPSIDFCDEMGDDHCSTPWDACCEDRDKLKSMRLSVQFVDSDGAPIQADLKQSMELKELDKVAIVGTVAETSTDTNVIINATGLYK